MPRPIRLHQEIEIQYIKSGTGAYAIGRRIYAFRRYNVFVIQPNVPHRFLPDPQVNIEKVYVYFQPDILGKKWLPPVISGLPVVLTLAERDVTLVEMSFRNIQNELENKGIHWQSMVTGELARLLILLQRAKHRKEPVAIPDPRISGVLDYLDANFCRAILVGNLARTFAMSPSHLAHRFKRQTNMGIRQYLLHRRIAEAKTILEGALDIKLTALAARVGFRRFNLFNHAFRRLTGMAPSDWRRISHLQSRK